MAKARSTKIIATLGPASRDPEIVRSLIRAGADCFRLNFSHGDGPSLQPLADTVRRVAAEEGVWIPILADIQGPKLRIGKMPEDGVTLKEGAEFRITRREIGTGDAAETHSPYEFLTKDVQPGSRILLADGAIELQAERVEDQDVVCKVIHGGRLYSNKGMNLPGIELSVETLTDKDRADLDYIAKSDFDMAAISFVRRASDVEEARRILGGDRAIPVMAKLERPESLANLSRILEASDGVMIARGDLGVEVAFERVPIIQKQLLERTSARGKWAVVATEMLRSMVLSTRPTRAEAADVANAVIDGADCVMLSEETAAGQHPVNAVDVMARIISEADQIQSVSRHRFEGDITSFSAGAAGAAVSAAERLGAKAILALAGSNLTALLLSKWRARQPIIALSASEPTLRRLNVLRSVQPVPIREKAGMDRQIAIADDYLRERGIAKPGDVIVVVGAIPLGEGRETNSIRFHRVREAGDA